MKNYSTIWKTNHFMSALFVLLSLSDLVQAQENFTTIEVLNNEGRFGTNGLRLNTNDIILGTGHFNSGIRSDFIIKSSTHLGAISLDETNHFTSLGTQLRTYSYQENQFLGVGDFNGDGKSEFISMSDTSLAIIGLDNSNNFIPITSQLRGERLGDSGWLLHGDDKVLGVGDFNGDGKSDFIIKSNTHIGIIGLNDSNNFTAFASRHMGYPFGNNGWVLHDEDQVLGVGNFDGDDEGKSEFIIKSSTHLGIIGLDESNNFKSFGNQLRVYSFEESQFLGVGDFNGDGKSEFISKGDADLAIIGLDDSNNFTPLTSQRRGERLGDSGWLLHGDDKVLGVGDFNGDEKSDFLIKSNTHIGIIGLNDSNNFTAFASRHKGYPFGNNGWVFNETDQILGVGDFNIDGRSDFIVKGRRGLGIIGLELPASCGAPARYAGADVGSNKNGIWLDKCYKSQFDYRGTLKKIVVYYTKTVGPDLGLLKDVDTNGDGILDMESDEIAAKVADWVEQGWTKFLDYGFDDPEGSDELDVHLFEMGKPGWCCHTPANRPPDMEFSANSARTSFIQDSDSRSDPRAGKSVIFHELWHASERSVNGGAQSEGLAHALSDHVDIDVDIYNNSFFYKSASGYLNSDVNNSLGMHNYHGALWWKYFMEQFGNDTTEPKQGADAVLALWQIPSALSLSTLKTVIEDAGDRTLESTWIDFTIANYAKQLTLLPHPSKYRYQDELQSGATAYPQITLLELDNILTSSSPPFTNSTGAISVPPWSARYFVLNINPGVQTISIDVDQTTNRRLGYSVLKIKGTDLTEEKRISRDFNHSFNNTGYEKIILVVTGLPEEQNANVNYSIEGR